MLRLQLVKDNQPIQTLPLRAGKTTIGRNPDNMLVIPDDLKVSRHHAVVEVAGDQCKIRDLGSRNGTFLGDKRLLPAVPERWLLDKTVQIGDCQLTLLYEAAEEEVLTQFATADSAANIAGMDAAGPDATPGRNPASVSPAPVMLLVSVEPATLQVEMGSVVTMQMRAINLGERVEHLYVTAEGIPAQWLQAPQPAFRLNPRAEDVATLMIQPPPTLQTKAGAYPLQLRVASQDDQTVALCAATLTVTGEIVQRIYYDLLVHPPQRTSSRQGNFQVQVTNRSPVALTLSLTAADLDGLCTFAFDHRQLDLAAGQEVTVRLAVRAKRPLPGREARAAPFTVVATAVEAQELTRRANGEWIQTPPAFAIDLERHNQIGTLRGVYKVEVANRSDEDLTIQLQARDHDEQCTYELQPATVSVPAGAERWATLTLRPNHPPLDGEQHRFPFWVEAHPMDAPQLVQRVEGGWTRVPPVFEITLAPQQAQGVGEGRFTLQIHNRGPGSFTADIEVVCDQPACQFVLQHRSLPVPKGQQVATSLQLRPRGIVLFGARRSYSFTVNVRAQQNPAEAQTVAGAYIQTRSWKWLLGLFFILFVLIWLLTR
ncbi:MAG: FHA domain-containing protein [Caldilineaceae bacterium]